MSALASGGAAVLDDEHRDFRDGVTAFLEAEVAPRYAQWQHAGRLDRDVWCAAAAQGLVALQVPESMGGLGFSDLRFRTVAAETAGRMGLAGFGLAVAAHNDLGTALLCQAPSTQARTEGLAKGEVLTATILGAQPAVIPTRDGWRISCDPRRVIGAATSDLVMLAVELDGATRLVCLDAENVCIDADGHLVGMRAAGFAKVRLDAVRFTSDDVLADIGAGALRSARDEHRVTLAALALGIGLGALDQTAAYARDRRAFGQPLAGFESTRVALGAVIASLAAARAALDAALLAATQGRLTPALAAVAKLAATDATARAVDVGVQLHGGYGYMLEYPIAHAYADARVLQLLGGATQDLHAGLADELLAC